MIQIPLPLDWTSRGGQNMVVAGEANREALDLLGRPQLWPSHCTILAGPPRSGRSTIAAAIAATGLQVIDDADRVDEAALFHDWNAARETGRALLLVAAAAPPIWTIALPDLRSRLATAGVARIHAPDEPLIEALISEGLSRDGTAYAPDVPPYLAARLPRCYQAIDTAITALNADSLSSGRKISLLKAKEVMEEIAPLFGE
ncbi:MAG TPA: chromosomal replication initiator DnaA [Sphingobium sp.]|nr:chromosomal replication initiator DnaA [Sphingobium sp.]